MRPALHLHPNATARDALQPSTDNHLLAALTAAERRELFPYLEPVELRPGRAIYEPGDPMGHAIFPTTGIISLLYTMTDGASAEVAITGNEGVVGIPLFMGGDSTPSRAVVVSPGHAYRLPKRVLKQAFERGGNLQHLLLRYTQALITQIMQTAVCNRHHSVEQQLCRWLLLSLDRQSSNEIHMTQELIANMLGVRREGVTEASARLTNSELIQHRRGSITVLDRPRLENRVCECYTVVKREADRLLAWKPKIDSGQAGTELLMRSDIARHRPASTRL